MEFDTHESLVATLYVVTTATLIIWLSAPTRSADQVTVYVMYSSYIIMRFGCGVHLIGFVPVCMTSGVIALMLAASTM